MGKTDIHFIPKLITLVTIWIFSTYSLILQFNFNPKNWMNFLFSLMLFFVFVGVVTEVVYGVFIKQRVEKISATPKVSQNRHHFVRLLFSLIVGLFPLCWIMKTGQIRYYNEYQLFLFITNNFLIYLLVWFYYSKFIDVILNVFISGRRTSPPEIKEKNEDGAFLSKLKYDKNSVKTALYFYFSLLLFWGAVYVLSMLYS